MAFKYAAKVANMACELDGMDEAPTSEFKVALMLFRSPVALGQPYSASMFSAWPFAYRDMTCLYVGGAFGRWVCDCLMQPVDLVKHSAGGPEHTVHVVLTWRISGEKNRSSFGTPR